MQFKNQEAIEIFKQHYQNDHNILLCSFILNVADEAEKEPNLTFEKFAKIFYELHDCVKTQFGNILIKLPQIMELFRRCWLYGYIIPKIGAK